MTSPTDEVQSDKEPPKSRKKLFLGIGLAVVVGVIVVVLLSANYIETHPASCTMIGDSSQLAIKYNKTKYPDVDSAKACYESDCINDLFPDLDTTIASDTNGELTLYSTSKLEWPEGGGKRTITVTLTNGSKVVATKTADVAFDTQEINGKGCGKTHHGTFQFS